MHNKPEPAPARKSTTTRVIGMARAIDAAKKLHRVLSISEPEPFVTPPAMSKDLEQEFAAGLEEYGLDTRMPVMGLDVLSHVAGMQERLPEIVEESKRQIEVETTRAQSVQEKGAFGMLPVRSSDAQSELSEGAKDLAGEGQEDGQSPARAASAGMKVLGSKGPWMSRSGVSIALINKRSPRRRRRCLQVPNQTQRLLKATLAVPRYQTGLSLRMHRMARLHSLLSGRKWTSLKNSICPRTLTHLLA
jgi:hypothetical protein